MEHYMATCRYKSFLLVLKSILQVNETEQVKYFSLEIKITFSNNYNDNIFI